jgi:hypothetical protein
MLAKTPPYAAISQWLTKTLPQQAHYNAAKTALVYHPGSPNKRLDVRLPGEDVSIESHPGEWLPKNATLQTDTAHRERLVAHFDKQALFNTIQTPYTPPPLYDRYVHARQLLGKAINHLHVRFNSRATRLLPRPPLFINQQKTTQTDTTFWPQSSFHQTRSYQTAQHHVL